MQSLPSEAFGTLNNSIYLNKSAGYFSTASKEPPEPFQEDPPILVNRSNSKPPQCHKLYSIAPNPIQQTFQNSLENSQIRRIVASKGEEGEVKRCFSKRQSSRALTKRLCQVGLAQSLQQMESCQSILSEEWKRKRDCLAARSRSRKAEMFRRVRQAAFEEAVLEVQEDNESVIQQEVNFEQEELKECRIQHFLNRQQFFVKEKEIMRQMKEFCLYGSINVEPF